jgi:hypothetical protein
MQNFNEQQLELIKNSAIVFATWETYKEVFKYFYVNGGFGFQSEFFDKQKEYGYTLDLLQAGCFPFQEGLFVYIPNNGTAFVKSIKNGTIATHSFNIWKCYEEYILTFDKKTFKEFSEIHNKEKQAEYLEIENPFIIKEQEAKWKKAEENLALSKEELTLFEKIKKLFKK